MIRLISVTLSLVLVLLNESALRADTWSNPPPKREAAISKWCKKGSKDVVYSSAPAPGYEQCGKIESIHYCDASGNRFIGPSTTPPAGYKECDGASKIYAEGSAGYQNDGKFVPYGGTSASKIENESPFLREEPDEIANYEKLLNRALKAKGKWK